MEMQGRGAPADAQDRGRGEEQKREKHLFSVGKEGVNYSKSYL
jgi:hypothetical protein